MLLHRTGWKKQREKSMSHPLHRWLRLILFIALSLAGCGGATGPPANDKRLPIAASILPLADFARQVGGDRVRVETLIPPGASPHTYELTPAQLQAVSGARALLLNGVGLEYWADKVVSAANNPDLVVVTASEGLDIIAGDEHASGGNPHVWLSPLNAIHQVELIRDALIQADPEGAEVYRANADRYIAELRALDRDARTTVAAFANRGRASLA
jgi:zinc transport system substrate-binding protein